jgi:predicted aspartyl protease
VHLEAIVDSGFSGDLCLPVDVAVHMGLELVGRMLLELADGTKKRKLVYRCEVELVDQTKLASAFLTSGEDALVGTNLMRSCRLTMDFGSDEVRHVSLKRKKS